MSLLQEERMEFNRNPVITAHALKRANERFGVPKTRVKSWLTKKVREAIYLSPHWRGHLYQNGGLRIIMRDRIVLTVYDAYDPKGNHG